MALNDDLAEVLRFRNLETVSSHAHDLVATALESMAPGADIRTTDYFAHSFVPDMVVTWKVGSVERRRHVHLRYETRDRAFEREAEFLSSTEPIFFGMLGATGRESGLEGPPPAPEARTQVLRAGRIDSAPGTLVTDASAVDVFRAAKRSDSRIESATGALLRGGHGTVGRSTARWLGDVYQESVQSIDRVGHDVDGAIARTTEALDQLRPMLGRDEYAEVERGLRGQWVRHGGHPESFPGMAEWDPALLPESELAELLDALLRSPEPIPTDQWRRYAGFLDGKKLAKILPRNYAGGRFNELAYALAAGWTAQWALVEEAGDRLLEGVDWFVENGFLGISVGPLRATFADDGRTLPAPRHPGVMPTMAQAEGRLRRHTVQAASFQTAVEAVDYAFRRPLSQALYDRVKEVLGEGQWEELLVKSLKFTLPGDRGEATADYEAGRLETGKVSVSLLQLVDMALSYWGAADSSPWITRLSRALSNASSTRVSVPIEKDASNDATVEESSGQLRLAWRSTPPGPEGAEGAATANTEDPAALNAGDQPTGEGGGSKGDGEDEGVAEASGVDQGDGDDEGGDPFVAADPTDAPRDDDPTATDDEDRADEDPAVDGA